MTKPEPIRPDPSGTAARETRTRREARPRVTLLRHGEPDWSPAGGPSVNDPELTSYGHAQAEAAARMLADDSIDAIYVSPYTRAQQTATPLAQATGLTPTTIEGIAEISVAAHGLSQEEVDRYFVEAVGRPLNEHWDGWPGAETFHEFHGRVTGAVNDILGRHGLTPEKQHDFTVWHGDATPHVVLVAHGGTNAVVLSHLLDMQPVPWEWVRLESELSAYSRVQARPIGPAGLVWSLQAFGCVDHIDEGGLRAD
jgi:probable phosphoglycerate mutase